MSDQFLQILSARVCQRRVDFLSIAIWLTTVVQLASAAEFIPFPAQPNHEFSQAYGISDDGRVVAGKSSVGDSLPQAFRWTDTSGMVGLGALPGDTFSGAGSNGSQPLSGDGSTIAGTSYNQDTFHNQAIIYTVAQGIRSIDISRPDRWTFPFGVSHDGSVVTGNTETRPRTQNGSFTEAFRWTEADGLDGLGHLTGHNQSYASDISDDGSLIVGTSNWWYISDDGEIEAGEWEIYQWTEATGMVGTGIIPSTRQVKVSGDGAIISGTAFVSSDTDQEAFYWTAETGVIGLGWVPGTEGEDGAKESQVRDMTPGGRLIVGRSGPSPANIPFVWSEEAGMEDFQQVLIDRHGLGDALAGWNLSGIQSVSANGQFFTGWSEWRHNPTGKNAAWVVRLDAPWGTLPLAADFDGDGDVDDVDFLAWQSGFGTQSGALKSDGDYDNDGNVDGNDFLGWQAKFGMSGGEAAASHVVPEPTSIVLALGIAVMGVLSRRGEVIRLAP